MSKMHARTGGKFGAPLAVGIDGGAAMLGDVGGGRKVSEAVLQADTFESTGTAQRRLRLSTEISA